MAQASQSDTRGLRYWMEQVVKEAEKARDGMKPDPVHDLRVAIRRCRSIGEGFVAIDSQPAWKKMRKAAKPLFSALGDLRDVQVQMEWVEKLGAPEDPVRAKLSDHFHIREQQLKTIASDELAAFDLDQWQQWATVLDEREKQIPPGSEVFQLMALERWQAARDLHTVALRNRSKLALHTLRIGLKKFRYIVENFLPEAHERWIKDLKKLQDLLGEIHDLDVLWDTARTIHAFDNPQQRQHWLALQKRERRQRLDAYRAKMVGRTSLWQKWRADLPEGEALHAAVLKFFETWAFFRDPDLSHTHRVLESSLTIFDRLLAEHMIKATEVSGVPLRDLLTVAVLTHESARAKKGKHQKRIVKEVQKIMPPPGWTTQHLLITGLVARYHRGALPGPSHQDYARLRQSSKNTVTLLAGIIRFADAFDTEHDGKIQQITVAKFDGALTVEAIGYEARTREAEKISAARHLLESVLRLPILVRAPAAKPTD